MTKEQKKTIVDYWIAAGPFDEWLKEEEQIEKGITKFSCFRAFIGLVTDPIFDKVACFWPNMGKNPEICIGNNKSDTHKYDGVHDLTFPSDWEYTKTGDKLDI